MREAVFWRIDVFSAIRVSVLGAFFAIVVVACGGNPAPSVPANFQMSGNEYTLIRLSWDAPTGTAVAAYELKRDGVLITPPAANETTTTNFGLSENTSYTYSLRACDGGGLCSDWATTSARTADDPSNNGGDTQQPTTPGTPFKTGATASSITLAWAASSDNVGVTGYEIWREDSRGWTEIGTTDGATLSFTDTGLNAGTTYGYKLYARDAADNWSGVSSILTADTSASTDTGKPSVPTSLTKTGSTANSISISWTASADNVGVTGYEVFRGTTSVGTTNGSTLSFSDTGLAAGTSYSYQVRARDAAGNWSAKSSALAASTAAAGTLNPPQSAHVPVGYGLVWNDEFDVDGLPNSSKWIYQTYGNSDGWANGELQYYSAENLNNTHVSGGQFYITARKETVSGPTGKVFNYTSARMATWGKASWTYGYFEVRAKMPCGAGTWPAIWMLGTTGGWPAGGEIDILEHFRGTNTSAAANVHWAEGGGHREISPKYMNVPTICSEFHNYWLKWTADQMEIGVDGDTMLSSSRESIAEGNWPFTGPQYMLLNLAIGGFGGGEVDNSIFPRSMVVDYVRVYQPQ